MTAQYGSDEEYTARLDEIIKDIKMDIWKTEDRADQYESHAYTERLYMLGRMLHQVQTLRNSQPI
jgi:hypothetical protein